MSTYEIPSSQTIRSSEIDTHPKSSDSPHSNKYWNMIDSSSSEIEYCESEGENFWCDIKINEIEVNAKPMKTKLKTEVKSIANKKIKVGEQGENFVWANKTSKAYSVPIKARDHLINFWSDFNNGEVKTLPCLGAGKSDSISRLSVDVMKELLEGLYNVDHLVVDCRFPYEYEGGHIAGAVNISSTQELHSLFNEPKALIFHCEFSSARAPKLAQYLRNLDRNRNIYPKLSLPEIYILEGGYKAFYNLYPEFCVPQNYVEMGDSRFRLQCIKEQNKRRINKKSR